MKRSCRSSVALPLVCDAAILGALNIYSSEENAFDLDELKLLEELASDIAYGIVSLRTRSAHQAAKEKLEFLANFGPSPTDGNERYAVTYMRVPGYSLKRFHDYDEAVDYRESLERTITASVPVLWLNAAQRVSLMRLGLPVLGAVDKLPASASPHAHA